MVGAELDPHDAVAVKDKVKDYHQTIAYVLFGALAPSPFPPALSTSPGTVVQIVCRAELPPGCPPRGRLGRGEKYAAAGERGARAVVALRRR